jgi:hypothetical protein
MQKSSENKLSYILSRIMQFFLVLLTIYSFSVGELIEGASCLFALFLTLLPALLTRKLELVLPWELIFLIVLALLLHVMGFVLNFYRLPGWDVLTHLTSSILIALLSFTIVIILDRYAKSIKLNKISIALFIIIFTLACGVVWEFAEFTSDFLTNGTQQSGYLDTIKDIMIDLFGGVSIAIIGTVYIGPFDSKIENRIEGLNVKYLLQRTNSQIKKKKKDGLSSPFSKIVPLLLIVVGIYFVIRGDYLWGGITFVSILSSFSPMIIRKHFVFLPWELSFLLFLFLGLHLSTNVISSALDLESITRFVYSGIVATFGLIGVVVLDRYSPAIKINPKILPFFIPIFVLAAGAFLEIGEFMYIIHFCLPYPTNYSLMIDFFYDLAAGVAIAIPGALYLKYIPERRFET